MTLFHNIIFPKIGQLVAPGGHFEGYLLVIQGDNAGPHQDREFTEYCTTILQCKWIQMGTSGSTDASHEQSLLGSISCYVKTSHTEPEGKGYWKSNL